MCSEHRWEVVREPHHAIREFVVELRCLECGARKFVDQASSTRVIGLEIEYSPKGKPGGVGDYKVLGPKYQEVLSSQQGVDGSRYVVECR